MRFDNERGKGDHLHLDGTESVYIFTTPEQLIVDFETEVRRWNRANGRAGSSIFGGNLS